VHFGLSSRNDLFILTGHDVRDAEIGKNDSADVQDLQHTASSTLRRRGHQLPSSLHALLLGFTAPIRLSVLQQFFLYKHQGRSISSCNTQQ